MSIKLMGLDISSTTIGISIIETDEEFNNSKLIYCDHIKPIKVGNIFERIKDTQNKIKSIIEKHSPNFISIENIIQFLGGGSTAKTIISLATYNRSVGLTCYDFLGRAPMLYNVNSIRAKLRLTDERLKKKDMPGVVEKHLGIIFPYVIKKGKIAAESEDRADSASVALYSIIDIKSTLENLKLDKKTKKYKEALIHYKEIFGKSYGA